MVHRAELGDSPPSASQDHKLLFQKDVFGQQGSASASSKKHGHSGVCTLWTGWQNSQAIEALRSASEIVGQTQFGACSLRGRIERKPGRIGEVRLILHLIHLAGQSRPTQ